MQGADAEQLPQPGVHAAGPDPVVLVGDPGEEAADEGAAAPDVREEVGDGGVGEQVRLRGDDEPVAGEIVFRVGEVGGEVGLPQGPVPGGQHLRKVHQRRQPPLVVTGPPGVPVVQNGHVGGDPAARHVR